MNIQTSLMAWYDFEEDYNLGHAIHDYSGRGNHIPTTGTFIEPVTGYTFAQAKAYRISGMNGYGIHPYFGCYHRDRLDAAATVYYPDFRLAAGSFTIAAWAKIDTFLNSAASFPMAMKFEEFMFRARVGSGNCTFRRYHTDVLWESVSSHAGSIILPDTWFFIVGWYDAVAGTLNLQINNETTSSTAATVSNRVSHWPFTVGFDLASGIPPHPSYASSPNTGNCWLAFWKRVITQAERIWLYNGGSGRTWDDVSPPAETECQAIDCCDQVSSYMSESATDSEAGQFDGSPCGELVEVSFDPPCGSKVVYPIWVTLSCNYDTAVIRYTTDGSDPDETSAIYATPIQVTSPSTLLKAKAYTVDCGESEVYSCNWLTYSDDLIFNVYCDKYTDTVGRWDEWAPNGFDDVYWWLEMTVAANTPVTRFELYQLDATALWTTGAAWSTNSPVTPPPPWPQDTTFAIYPLQFNEVGVGILNAAYQATFGTITAGTHQYLLTGEPIVASGGIYKLILFLASGETVHAYADYSDCDACATPPCGTEPVPCPKPVINSIVAGCQGVIVNFDVTAPDRNWAIYYREDLPGSVYALGASGSGSGTLAAPIIGLAHNTTYIFYVRQELTEATYDHCEDWTDSDTSSMTTLQATSVTISTSSTLVDSGDNVTITVGSSAVPAGGTVTVTSNPVLGGTPWAVTPNTTGQTSVFAIAANTVFTVTIAGGCGTATATVSVLVTEAVTCDDSWALAHPALLVSDPDGVPQSQMFAPCHVEGDPSETCAPPVLGDSDWDGLLIKSVGLNDCYYASVSGQSVTGNPLWRTSALIELFVHDAAVYGGPAGTNWWILSVLCSSWSDAGVQKTVWVGAKTNGTTPEGTYTRLATGYSMCDTSLAALTVAAI